MTDLLSNELIDEGSATALRQLSDELQQTGHNLVAFLGAGTSRQAGLPLWKELMEKMDRETEKYSSRPPHVRRSVLRTSDLLWQAEFFRDELDRRARYEGFLEAEFGGQLNDSRGVFKQIARLRFRHFLTTNFDSFIEQSLQAADVPFKRVDWTNRQACRDFFLRYLAPSTPPAVIHLHGRADQPASIILTHEDYVQRYVSTSEYVEKVSVLFATLRLVFIGFSLEDPDLKFILRQVNTRFGTGDVQNFAIIGFPRDAEGQAVVERERLERQFGISAIFYDEANGHQALGSLLAALSSENPEQKTGTISVAENWNQDPNREPTDFAEYGDGISVAKIWNQDPNKNKFGGLATAQGRVLRVHDHVDEGKGIHGFLLSVESQRGALPLTGIVKFHLHPTFPRPVVEVPVVNGTASLKVHAYGAFTAGAECGNPPVRLELDLADETVELPADFRAL